MRTTAIHPMTRATRLVPLFIAGCLVCCLATVALAENQTFVALSLRNCTREIALVGGEATKLRAQRANVYFLAGITRPAFVVFDPDSRDAILVGEQTKGAPALTMDDWITALKAAIVHPDQDPGVTIDPIPCQACSGKGMLACPHMSTQKVKFFGGIENTQFGQICYESDWWMKLLAAGKIQSPVKGVRSLIELQAESVRTGSLTTSLTCSRFWFFPVINRVNLLDNLVLLQDFRLAVFTEVMYVEQNGRSVPDPTRQTNSASDTFAAALTDSFGPLAELLPSLASLRQLARLSALAKGCARSSASFDFRQFVSSCRLTQVTTPREKEIVIGRDSRQTREFRGGVELKALTARLQGGDASAFRQIVLTARPAKDAVSWVFIVNLRNGLPEGVIIPPQSEPDHDVTGLLAQGRFLYIQNQFADAAKCFDSILKEVPDCDEAAWLKAVALREAALAKSGAAFGPEAQNIEVSTRMLEELAIRNPQCEQAFFQLGVTHRAFRLHAEAIKEFEQAIKLSPDFAAAHYMLGLAWKDLKNYANAAKCFRATISLETDTDTARDAAEQLALVEKSLKGDSKRTLKEYSLPQHSLSLRYPDNWVAMTPEEMLKRARGNTILTARCVLVIANPDNWSQNVTIQIREAKGLNIIPPGELESFAETVSQDYGKQWEGFKKISHQIIEVADVPALEFNCSSLAWGKRQQARSVSFVKQERLFTITCTAAENDFADAEANAFQFIIDTLKIGARQQ